MGGNQLSLPILYKANETDFTHMGLGVLVDTVEAKVTEERNGVFELEMVYPTQSELFKELKVDRLIKVDANPTLLDQRFKIVKISSATGEMAKVHAEHVSYLTQELQLEPEVHYGGSAREALATWANNIVDTHPFTTDSDIQTLGNGVWRVEELDSARRALGGVRGSMLDTYGGEYRFDNYNIQLLKARGNSDTLLIAYGRNLTKLEQEEEIANTFTSVYPFARYTPEREEGAEEEPEEVLITLDERFIDSEHVDKYARRKILTLDLTDDGIKDQETLRARAVRYIEDNRIGVPRVNLRVAYQDLAQTLDYKDLQILEKVDLTDHVLILFEDFGVDRIAKIIKVVWDVLMERYDLLEIGEPRASLSDSISATVDGRVEKVESTINKIQASADGKNTNYSGPIEPTGDLKEGDLWLKPIGGKDTELYEFKNGVWRFILSTGVMTETKDKIDKAVEDLNEVKETAEGTATDISNAIQGSGFINLADLVASKVSGDEASSLFFQEAEQIGLAYEENGEIKAMIGIVDGQVIQRGEKIFLDGDEVIANGTLTVTEDMFAQGITFDWAKGQTIDASQIRVINLDFDSMSGGAIELNEGFRITHNGQNVLSIDAKTGRVVFNAPGVATKEDLEEIELTPGKSAYELAVEDGFVGTEQDWLDSLKGEDGKDGPQGPQGPEGQQGPEGPSGTSQYVYIRYSTNANGNPFTSTPNENTKYIGIVNTPSSSAPSSYTDYTWTKFIGENGEQGPRGIAGEAGEDGRTPYYHQAWAEDDEGTGFTFDWDETKTYVGSLWNYSEQASQNPSDYYWQQTTEGLQGQIDEKASNEAVNEIENQLSGFVDKVELEDDIIGPINASLGAYMEDLSGHKTTTEEAISGVRETLESNQTIIQNMGEMSSWWNFTSTNIVMSNNGLLVGTITYDTNDKPLLVNGIQVGPERIDFISNYASVANISGDILEIKRGIFAKSATIGEHKIETIAGGHTVWQWVE